MEHLQTGITVRRMEYLDLDGVAALEQEIFTEPWTWADFERELSKPDSCYLVAAAEDGEILGYCGLWNVSGEGQIYNVAVREESRGQGIARKMMERLLAEGRACGVSAFTLEVRAGNIPAIRLYHSLGFADAGLRPGFYAKPTEDAQIMWLTEQ